MGGPSATVSIGFGVLCVFSGRRLSRPVARHPHEDEVSPVLNMNKIGIVRSRLSGVRKIKRCVHTGRAVAYGSATVPASGTDER